MSHDTKFLRFELPDKEAVAGLPVTCKWAQCQKKKKKKFQYNCSDVLTMDSCCSDDAAALLTKFKKEGAEKAVLRPYTPVNDEGKY